LPQAEIGASAQRQRFNPGALGQDQEPREFSLYNTGVTVSYNLDPAGSNRRAIEALSARADTRQFEWQAARLILAGNIATAAFARAQISAQIESTTALVANLEQQRDIARARLRLGNAAADEVLALDTQTEQLRAELPVLRQQLAETEHLLATLAGRAPGQSNVPDFALSEFTLPQDLPLIVPSQLVRQRPDILAAEAMVHAANADYRVSVAQMYPQLNLSATLGTQALTGDALFGGQSIIWNIIGQLTQPLFNPGLPHEKRAALAGFDATTAHYKGAVLEALRDVANVLVAVDTNAHALAAQSSAAAAAQESLTTMQRRYQLGAASYVEVLIAAHQAERAQLAVTAARADRLANSAAFYVAMGGGGGPVPADGRDEPLVAP
jgi:NodT family efflux transporter outer membrane factor (OMF) lipoprotein